MEFLGWKKKAGTQRWPSGNVWGDGRVNSCRVILRQQCNCTILNKLDTCQTYLRQHTRPVMLYLKPRLLNSCVHALLFCVCVFFHEHCVKKGQRNCRLRNDTVRRICFPLWLSFPKGLNKGFMWGDFFFFSPWESDLVLFCGCHWRQHRVTPTGAGIIISKTLMNAFHAF